MYRREGDYYGVWYHKTPFSKPEDLEPLQEEYYVIFEHNDVGSIRIQNDGSVIVTASTDTISHQVIFRAREQGKDVKRKIMLEAGESVKFFLEDAISSLCLYSGNRNLPNYKFINMTKSKGR